MKKNILLTFDYELFLGARSGSVENCLLKPTDLLLHVLEKNKAKAIFFIDTTYLFRLEELSRSNSVAAKDFDKIKQQLSIIVRKGHYIFHHLHPHWLDAEYMEQKNEWVLTKNHRFSFNDINSEEKNKIFEYSNKILQTIYLENNIDKMPQGYRAGGLFIEPFQNFIPYFSKFNIKYEFSVVPGLVKKGDKLFYDFSNVPITPYSFEIDVTKKMELGSFNEYPVSTLKIKNLSKILNGIYYRIHKNGKLKIYGDGSSVSSEINSSAPNRTNKISKLLILDIPISNEILNPIIELECRKYLKKNNYLHFLSHPKLLSPQSLTSLDLFLKYVTKKYSVQFEFDQFITEK